MTQEQAMTIVTTKFTMEDSIKAPATLVESEKGVFIVNPEFEKYCQVQGYWEK